MLLVDQRGDNDVALILQARGQELERQDGCHESTEVYADPRDLELRSAGCALQTDHVATD